MNLVTEKEMFLYRLRKVCANIYFWLYTFLFFTFWLSLCAITWLFTFPFDYERRCFHTVLHTWCFLYLKLCPFWRFRIEGRQYLPKEACVFAVNHQSLFDIVVFLALNRHFKWVAKKELFSRPFVGWLLFFGRDVSLDRSSLRDASRMLSLCNAWLQRSVSVTIFPEGHRSPDGRVARFKLGAFQIAKDAGCSLVPAVISGPVESIHGYFIEPKVVRVRLEFLSPVLAKELKEAPLEDLAKRVEENIRDTHRRLSPTLYAAEKRNQA